MTLNKYIRREKKYHINKEPLLEYIKKFSFYFRSSRIINSIYFDRFDERYHLDGEEGIVPRKKVRIRWYGSAQLTSEKCNLEIKKTLINEKIKFSQPWIKIENIYKNEEFENLIKEKNKIISNKLYPKIYITYRRYYFENPFKERITVEDNICYKEIRFNIKAFKYEILKKKLSNNSITEIKYKNLKYLKFFESNFFPVRFSKYSEGINLLR